MIHAHADMMRAITAASKLCAFHPARSSVLCHVAVSLCSVTLPLRSWRPGPPVSILHVSLIKWKPKHKQAHKAHLPPVSFTADGSCDHCGRLRQTHACSSFVFMLSVIVAANASSSWCECVCMCQVKRAFELSQGLSGLPASNSASQQFTILQPIYSYIA